jgi:hypothetical protein
MIKLIDLLKEIKVTDPNKPFGKFTLIKRENEIGDEYPDSNTFTIKDEKIKNLKFHILLY